MSVPFVRPLLIERMVVQRQGLARIGRLISLAPVPPNAVDLRSGRVGKLEQMLHEVGPIRVAAMLHIDSKGHVEIDYETATASDGGEVGGGEGGHGRKQSVMSGWSLLQKDTPSDHISSHQ